MSTGVSSAPRGRRGQVLTPLRLSGAFLADQAPGTIGRSITSSAGAATVGGMGGARTSAAAAVVPMPVASARPAHCNAAATRAMRQRPQDRRGGGRGIGMTLAGQQRNERHDAQGSGTPVSLAAHQADTVVEALQFQIDDHRDSSSRSRGWKRVATMVTATGAAQKCRTGSGKGHMLPLRLGSRSHQPHGRLKGDPVPCVDSLTVHRSPWHPANPRLHRWAALLYVQPLGDSLVRPDKRFANDDVTALAPPPPDRMVLEPRRWALRRTQARKVAFRDHRACLVSRA